MPKDENKQALFEADLEALMKKHNPNADIKRVAADPATPATEPAQPTVEISPMALMREKDMLAKIEGQARDAVKSYMWNRILVLAALQEQGENAVRSLTEKAGELQGLVDKFDPPPPASPKAAEPPLINGKPN